MKRPRISLVAHLIVLIAVLAGCGGSDHAGSGSTQPAPREQRSAEDRYRERAGAVCQALDRLVAVLPRPASPSQLGPHFERVHRLGKPALRRLAALRPPPRLAGPARRAVALARQEVALIGGLAQALKRSSDPAATLRRRFPRIQRLIVREDALWRVLGIPACADARPRLRSDGTV